MVRETSHGPDRQLIVAVLIRGVAVRDSFRFLLEASGRRVETYASANHFLSKLWESAATCLLLEQELPDMSGLDLLGLLHNRGRRIRALLVAEHLTRNLLDLPPDLVRVAKKPLTADVLFRFLGQRDWAGLQDERA